MVEWFSELASFDKVYWTIAGVASLFFVFVAVSTLMGGDTDDIDGDVDADIEGDVGVGFQFFTFKNLVAFFTIFGWSGISCIDAGYSQTMTIVISAISGLVMMFAMTFLIYQLSKLKSSGTLKMQNAKGAIGEVYLTIGNTRSSMGKVQITVQGALRDLNALTDEESDLKTGSVIQVTEVTKNGILIVEQLKK
ncbi:MAG: hypothetical protein COA50_09475 [Flavobacteriaceae bacterium]|nr:MAG: hypothetical protein COA50_09475 [Flavobacteriaceae bacterium]